MKFRLTISSFFIAGCLAAQQPVKLTIIELPPYHQEGSPVYVAGSFNGWNPANESFRMKWEEGHYSIELPAGTKGEYKITAGKWDKVESGPKGEQVGNRVL